VDTLEAIKHRRSIRTYKTDPVDDKTLEIILDAARLAPSWANTQCWKFIVIRDNTIKTQLLDTFVQRTPTSGDNPAKKSFKSAPVVVVSCAEKRISGFEEAKAATDKGEYWFLYDVGVAMENLVLAATSLGLSTVHIGLFDTAKVAEILGVPDNYAVVSMTPLGYSEHQPKPRPRKTLEEIIFREKFGQK
jgi:nitroreductase